MGISTFKIIIERFIIGLIINYKRIHAMLIKTIDY